MTPRVIGIDLSLRSTGIADFTHVPGQVITTTIRSGPADGDGVYGPHARLTAITEEIREYISYQGPHPALVVIEGPSYNSKGAGTWDRAGLWWMIVNYLIGRYPVAVVPPALVKKYATGKGGGKDASKAAVCSAAAKRYGRVFATDDEADAFVLAAMGLDHLGCPVAEVPKLNREALAKVGWPQAVPDGA